MDFDVCTREIENKFTFDQKEEHGDRGQPPNNERPPIQTFVQPFSVKLSFHLSKS